MNIGFSISRSLKYKNSFIPKNDPHIPVQNSEIIKSVVKRDDRYFYLSSLDELRKRNLYLQSGDINYSTKTAKVAFAQNKHISYSRAIGRVASVLDEITPNDISTFEITNLNADQGLHKVTINRERFNYGKTTNTPLSVLPSSKLESVKYTPDDYAFNPPTKLPSVIWKLSPDIKSQIGGPDGFYFGDVRLAFNSEIIFKRNLTIVGRASAGIVNNLSELKLPSDSILPHVRTDIVQYMKQGTDYSVDALQINYFNNPYKNLYTKLSAGIFEAMFGGYGGEILYRRFESNFAVGADIWRVQQRQYNQLFSFLPYKTTTGHISLYYQEPRSKILFQMKGGKFLAKDSGINFDFSRRFSNGLQIGAFFTLTDISREEFGEGSFDKGFYFFIPLEQFSSKYSKDFTGFGLRPVTRDGGAMLNQSLELWGVTDQASMYNITKSWGDLYD